MSMQMRWTASAITTRAVRNYVQLIAQSADNTKLCANAMSCNNDRVSLLINFDPIYFCLYQSCSVCSGIVLEIFSVLCYNKIIIIDRALALVGSKGKV